MLRNFSLTSTIFPSYCCLHLRQVALLNEPCASTISASGTPAAETIRRLDFKTQTMISAGCFSTNDAKYQTSISYILENRKYFQMQKSLCVQFEIFLPIAEFLFTKAL